MIRSLAIAPLLLLASTVSAGEIYRTVDDNGRVIFSDHPVNERSESIRQRTPNTLPETEITERRQPPRQEAPEAPVDYALRIASPAQDAVILAGQRNVTVALNLDPQLHPDHRLAYYMSGELIAETRSTTHTIEEIPVGSRQLQVRVLDHEGFPVATSNTVTVHVQRPSLLRPRPN
ncbi:DUF4124 domain-containing protein [Marinimicrobium alkaliphilum]|uniref:DUF4124 domain-containing protein n=1 Tax=Marinimicrobium alkaliphilum TaxID=2202654 RepID=UPI000DB934B9|nr:DUF4124 domain-containing protein [Marinimicrobium alkaliphilum]